MERWTEERRVGSRREVQAAGVGTPIESRCILERNRDLVARIQKLAAMTPTPQPKQVSYQETSRARVRELLAALAPSLAPAQLAVKDAEVLSRLTKSVILAAEENVLTEDEASAVLQFIAERFISRKFDEVLNRIATPQSRGWFVLAGHSHSQNSQ